MFIDNKETRESICKLLQENEMLVSFTKVNGDNRIMKCTTDSALIPTESLSKNETEKPDIMTLTALKVFDIDKMQWRSFKWDSIIKYEILPKFIQQNQ